MKFIIVFVIAVKFFPFSVVENIEHLINMLAVYVDKPDRAILADAFDAAIQRPLVHEVKEKIARTNNNSARYFFINNLLYKALYDNIIIA